MDSQISGISILSGGSKQQIQVYLDPGTFTKYYCDNFFNVPLTTSTRRVKEVVYNNATFDEALTVKGGTNVGTATFGEYVCTPTSLAVCQALIYA